MVYTVLVSILLLFCLGTAANLIWIRKPQHTPVLPGQDLVLNCQAAVEAPSRGRLSYTWLFNQTEVQAKASVFANASLFVPLVSEEDEGEYTCVARRENGQEVEEISASAHVVMAYIKDFIMHPQNTHVTVGTDAVLTCVTGRSVPYPTVHWELNGARMDGARTVTATYGSYDETGLSSQVSMKLVYRVEDEVERVFRCAARNPLTGEELFSQEATVTAEMPKDVTEMTPMSPLIVGFSTPEVVAMETQRLALPCQVVGYPQPYVLWRKDGEFVDDSRVYIMADHTLIIPDVGQEDAGKYTCEARNSLGSDISNTTSVLVAKISLTFKREPSDASSLAGHPVTLQCSPPDSVPPATVTWYKDYAPFVQRTGQFAATIVRGSGESWDLYFSSVQESDEGDYYCVASNNYSTPNSRTSKVAQLTVYGAPVITDPPINTEILKGTLLHMSCQVDLRTVRSVYWTFDGQTITASQTVAMTDQGQNLWISDVGKSWEGQYTCVAENSYGQKTASASVTVIVPPVTLQNLGARSVLLGNVILLPCFIYSDPDPAFVWFHDGQPVVEDERRKLLTTGLFFNPVTLSDRGDYSCQGTNKGGQAWSNGTLDVRVSPSAAANQSVAAVLGQPLTLTCIVQGHPTPSVSWLHNGTEFVNGSVVSASGKSTITRRVFSWSMAGNYTCVAENEDGIARADIHVAAQAVPIVMQIQGKTAVDINRSINLTCVFSGVPAPTVTWLFTGEKISASMDGRVKLPSPDTLLITFAQKRDEGRYECVASNIVGNSSSHVDIIIVEPPRPPELLEARPLSKNSVLLRWQHVFQAPETTVDTFSITYRQRVGGRTVMYPEKLSSLITQWEVDGLKPGTEYVFTVSAENSAGVGLPSNSLSAITFESGPLEPQNVRVVSTEARRVRISWEVPAQTNGNIHQYQLQYRRQAKDTDYSVLSVSSSVLPTQTVILENLQPYTVYELRVRAANMWNRTLLWGQFSSPLTVLTNMTKPTAPPASMMATSLDPFSVRAEWHPVPESSRHGPITGYRLTYFMENQDRPLRTVLTNRSQHSLTVTGLSPWTLYSLTLEAENPKGFSPSKTVTVKTSATAPSAPPQSVTAVPLHGDVIRVDWQPIPRKDVNCELTSYVVQYRLTGTTQWTELVTSDNITLSADISDVKPWSWYEVRVAGETLQVTPGRSPFSSSVEVQTYQTAAGRVESLSFSVTTTTISLSWAPTQHPNGVVSGYRVDYCPMTDQECQDGKKTVVVNVTHAELAPLLPGVMYNVSIFAINMAGAGQPTILRIRTASLSSTASSPATTTPSPAAFTLGQVQNTTTTAGEGSSSSHDLPAIVAGSLVGAAILFIILAIFLCRCLKARRQHRAKYLIQDGGMSFSRAAAGSFYRHIDESDIIITAQHPALESSDRDTRTQQQQQQQTDKRDETAGKQHVVVQREDSAPQQLTDPTWFTQQAHRMAEAAEGPAMYLPGAFSPTATATDGRPSSFPLPSPGSSDVFTVEGIENPAFIDDRLSLPGLPPPDRTPEGAASPEGIEKRSSALVRKRGRMRSESAAAIAVMRSATSASLAADDTESLLSNEFTNVDTEVVFKHRTVL